MLAQCRPARDRGETNLSGRGESGDPRWFAHWQTTASFRSMTFWSGGALGCGSRGMRRRSGRCGQKAHGGQEERRGRRRSATERRAIWLTDDGRGWVARSSREGEPVASVCVLAPYRREKSDCRVSLEASRTSAVTGTAAASSNHAGIGR